jgi:hypothetical protein
MDQGSQLELVNKTNANFNISIDFRVGLEIKCSLNYKSM